MNKKALLALVLLAGCSSAAPLVRPPMISTHAALSRLPPIMTAFDPNFATPTCSNGASGFKICDGAANLFMATPNGEAGRFGPRKIQPLDLPVGVLPYATATGGVSGGPALAGIGFLTPGQALLTTDYILLNVSRPGFLTTLTANTLSNIAGLSTIVVRVRVNFSPTTLTCTLNAANQTCQGFDRIAVTSGDRITIQGTWNAALQPGITATAEITN